MRTIERAVIVAILQETTTGRVLRTRTYCHFPSTRLAESYAGYCDRYWFPFQLGDETLLKRPPPRHAKDLRYQLGERYLREHRKLPFLNEGIQINPS